MKWIVTFFLLLSVAVFSLWCTGDVMRKNDQASILAGSYEIAHGRMQPPAAYYQFDKTYVLYGVCAALLKGVSFGNPIAATNLGVALIFWQALFVFVARFRRKIDPVVLLCFLTAPAVLLNTLYVNSSVLSSAFLLLCAAFLLNPRGDLRAALFFFLAVGARADVILLLPWLLWLATPLAQITAFFSAVATKRGCLRAELARFSKQGLLSAAGIAALGAGHWICPDGGVAFDLIFNWKMVAGYTAFGFGAAGILFAIQSFRLARQTAAARGIGAKLYGAAGLLAFLLPVLFFLPQLHSPRYFWRGCEAVLLLSVSGRLPAWRPRPVAVGLALIALLPLGLGIALPSLQHPRLAVTNPTLFPSGDGFYPMGGTLSFMMRLRQSAVRPVDHNQQVWAAVHAARFEFSSENLLDVLWSPMHGYFRLEAALRGGTARCLPLKKLAGRPFYADSRSLMRDDPKTPLGDLPQVLALPCRFVSPVSSGLGVLRFGAGDLRWGLKTQLLNRLFAGSEYRILSAESIPDPSRYTVRFSPLPFPGSAQDPVSGLYYRENAPPGQYSALRAVAVLPSWMSLRSFQGSSQ